MRFPARGQVFVLCLLLASLPQAVLAKGEPTAPGPGDFSASFGQSTPEAQGIDSAKLIALTEMIQREPLPIYSLLISRHGKLVYELYTSALTREHAHYLMSVTKSVLSALIGIAIDRHLLPGPDAPIAALLPPALFGTEANRARFGHLTLRDVMGMSALDTPDPPRDRSPAALDRFHRFLSADNRVAFALQQPILPQAGTSFQYNDENPMVPSGVIHYATGRAALEFAEAHLFSPLRFRDYEWMHQDPSGIDSGGYGLRLRPIDMQKFGVLYLQGGRWGDRQIISRAWVERSFTPWNHSRPERQQPDYGWFFWARDFGPGWTAHVANGWKGQRIAVFPEQGLVVTLTGCLAADEDRVFARIINEFVRPALPGPGSALPEQPALRARLADLMERVRAGEMRIAPETEWRMVPSIGPKERRRPYRPLPQPTDGPPAARG